MQTFIEIAGYIIIAPFAIGSVYYLGLFAFAGIYFLYEKIIKSLKS